MGGSVTREYLETLPGHVAALQSLKEAYLQSEEDAEESIIRLAHTLKGSGGMFGFDEITASARIVEDKSAGNFMESIDRLIESLQRAVESEDIPLLDILVIDDDPIISLLVKDRLSEFGRIVHLASTGAQAEEILLTHEIGIILLDLVLPDIDGRNFLISLRQRPGLAGVPVIMASGKEGSRVRAECYALGADGYFVKPYDLDELAAAVFSRLEKVSINTRERRTDALTGLANRAGLVEGFNRLTATAERNHEKLSLAIVDVDDFKSVNDTYGHKTGDKLLIKLSGFLRSTLRDTDLLGRWGGEEFVIIFPGVDRGGSKLALEKALGLFGEKSIESEDNRSFSVSLSGGVVDVDLEQTLDETVADADHLLYRAKEAGQTRILIEEDDFTPPPKQIFVVEDDDIVAKTIKHRLSKEGWEVIHFPDGSSAFEAAPDFTPSLVLLDVKMPGMDGFELLEKLKELTHYKSIPIVMLTSMGSEDDIVRAFEAGAIDYIPKPFSPIELVARMRRLMKD